ncbi:MAG: effector-associated domain EAD1-containing protein [Scytonema sp. PMC 1069.18]|nr:effector-associated domain EAD1-containing protein [Scytonema sp. PMC 1069.18]MEC4883632.1 effector-associated domain EAD1-containing protein [Scytonema sp. PMC 1070.18]
MALSGQQLEQLRDALREHPNKPSLEQMLFFILDKNLDAIAGGDNLENIVFELIKAAKSQGWLKQLICAARQSNPENPRLQEIALFLVSNTLQIVENPFGCRGRITDPKKFFNREELLRQVFEELRKGSSISLVGELCGQDTLSFPVRMSIAEISRETKLSLDEVTDALKTLENHDVVTQCDRLYIYTVELMRRWVAKTQ